MFKWVFGNTELENNYNILLKEFNKLNNQNLKLIEQNNDLYNEINELNDLILACNLNFEDRLKKEEVLINENDKLKNKIEEMNAIVEQSKLIVEKENKNKRYVEKNEAIRLEQYDYYDSICGFIPPNLN